MFGGLDLQELSKGLTEHATRAQARLHDFTEKLAGEETSEETLARYGASTAGATTSAAASKSTAQLWLDAELTELGARHAAAMEVVQQENEALRTVLEARGVSAEELDGLMGEFAEKTAAAVAAEHAEVNEQLWYRAGNTIATLEARLDQAQTELAALNAKLNMDSACTAAAAVLPLPSELATVAVELGEANRTIMALKTRLAAADADASASSARLGDMPETDDAGEQWQRKTRQLEAELAATRTDAADLQAQVGALVSAREREAADAEENIAMLQARAQKAISEAKAAKAATATLQGALDAALAAAADTKTPSELQKQVTKLEEELKFKQERVKHYRDKCKQLEEGGRRKEVETTVVKEERTAALRDAQAEVRQLQATARRLEGEKAKLKGEAAAEAERLALDAMEKAAVRVREMQGRVEGLEAELQMVRNAAETDTNSRVEAMQERVSSIQSMLAATRADKERTVAELRTKVKDLQQQLGVARAMGGSVRRGGGGDMEGSESTVTSGADMARMAALETELAERQGKITELGLRVMELEGDLESVAALHRYEVAELSREAAKARQQADELRSAAQSGSAAADDQTRDLRATLRTQTAAAAAAAEKAAAHVKQLETKVEALQTTADERQSASERALGEQQEMVASLESELEAVSHNLVLRGVEVNELQQLVKSLREELTIVGEAHKNHLAKLQKQLDDAHTQLKAANVDKFKQVAEWEERASFYQEEVEKARQRAEEKDRKVMELMDAFTALEGDVATARTHSTATHQHEAALSALRSELSTTNLRCHAQEGTIRELRAELDAQRTELDAQRTELEACEEALKATVQTEMRCVELQATVRALNATIQRGAADSGDGMGAGATPIP